MAQCKYKRGEFVEVIDCADKAAIGKTGVILTSTSGQHGAISYLVEVVISPIGSIPKKRTFNIKESNLQKADFNSVKAE